MAAAPASLAFKAPFTLKIPFTIKGTSISCTISFNSFTFFLPAGGTNPFKNGKPAASISMAIAKASASLASFNFSTTISLAHGLIVGTPIPSFSLIFWVAPIII